MSLAKNEPVIISRIGEYDTGRITEILNSQLAALGITGESFENKRVVIKPNLIMKKSPEYAATSSPEILDALLTILDGCSPASVVIAESSGGPYTKQSLEAAYNVCGIKSVTDKHNAMLNFDTTYKVVDFSDGKTVKSFNIISPIADADIVISLPRLKTHSLTGMSGAVKNYFGVIPGLEKFELHARFPDYNDFSSMLVDLATLIATKAETINILDAIVGMEGNGPTGGSPRRIGAILTSRSAFAIDSIAKELICTHGVLSVKEADARGLASSDADNINTLGDDYKALIVKDFKQPDSRKRGLVGFLQTFSGGAIGEYFRPRPVIGKSCIGCGECVRSCPKETISLVSEGNKRIASIKLDKCIRCFCCQELCPIHAIEVKRRGIISFINRAKRDNK